MINKEVAKEMAELARKKKLLDEIPGTNFTQGFINWYTSLPENDEDDDEVFEEVKKKPWDTIIMFAPESLVEDANDTWHFNNNDGKACISKNGAGNEVRCLVELNTAGPNHIVVYSDELLESAFTYPEMIESTGGLPSVFGMSDGDKIVIETE